VLANYGSLHDTVSAELIIIISESLSSR